jgi:broad specificity phosphatase PhoE
MSCIAIRNKDAPHESLAGADRIIKDFRELDESLASSMSVRITYFVHGNTIDNENDIATGWQPGELSAQGREQSKTLGKLMSGIMFDAIFSSDLKRASDSAQLAFGDKYNITTDDRLRECDYGKLTGTSFASFKLQLANYISNPFPSGESYSDVEARMRDFLKDIRKKYSDKHIAIIAHQAPQLALDVIIKGKSWRQAFSEDWRNTHTWQPGWEYVLDRI